MKSMEIRVTLLCSEHASQEHMETLASVAMHAAHREHLLHGGYGVSWPIVCVRPQPAEYAVLCMGTATTRPYEPEVPTMPGDVPPTPEAKP